MRYVIAHCSQDPWLDQRFGLTVVVDSSLEWTAFLAFDRHQPDRKLHIKALHVARLEELRILDRFEREAAVLAQFSHDQLPTYVDHFQTGEGDRAKACLVTEWVAGEPLRKELDHHRYSAIEVLNLLEDVLEALVYLHDRTPPVTHRDLRPETLVRWTADRRIVLSDFGFVSDGLGHGTLTRSYTLGYAAPEQLAQAAEPRSDLYAVGIIGLELLLRQAPHTFSGPEGVLGFDDLTASLHPAMQAWLRGLLAPQPQDRTPTAREAQHRLRRVRDLMQQARQAPVLISPPPRRPPLRWALPATLVGLLLMAAIAVGRWTETTPLALEFTDHPYQVQIYGDTITGFLSPRVVQVSSPKNLRVQSPLSLDVIKNALVSEEAHGRPFHVEGELALRALYIRDLRVLVVRTPQGDRYIPMKDVFGFRRLDLELPVQP